MLVVLPKLRVFQGGVMVNELVCFTITNVNWIITVGSMIVAFAK